MCQPISWIEKQGHIFFLTSKDLRGKVFAEFKKYNSGWSEDMVGHGAIEYFYPESKGGSNFEVNDLRKPSAFPKEIVNAMKQGLFRGLFTDEGLLLKRAHAEYQKIKQGAYAEYQKIKQGAYAEYEKIRQGASAEYDKIRQGAWNEYKKIEQGASAEYQKIEQGAFWDLWAKPENRIKAWR